MRFLTFILLNIFCSIGFAQNVVSIKVLIVSAEPASTSAKFAKNSSVILNTEMLDRVIATMQQNPNAKIELSGFALRKEKKAEVLAAKRSSRVYDYIVSKGIEKERIKLGPTCVVDGKVKNKSAWMQVEYSIVR
jgi:hypothetical protein